jgi:hypothetical protein
MEEDPCINEVELDVAAAMSRCGIPVALRVRSIVTSQTLAVDETFQTPGSRVSLANGTVLALEPSHNEGIYRALPAKARVLSFTVTLLVPPKIPITSNTTRLDIVLVTNPYATRTAADTASFTRVAISGADVSSAPLASIPLTQSTKLAFNPMAEPGNQTSLNILTPVINGNPVPVFLADARYPALVFRTDVGDLLPPEVHILISVSYEVSRAVEL